MCGGAKWKREQVADHKFDFINVEEYTDNGFLMRLQYMWVYVLVLKSFMVYVLDIFSAITMLTTTSWSNRVFQNCTEVDGCVAIPFNVGKWLFVGCIIFSFLLLAYESRKARKIIKSRDISYAFTNIMANNYYSLRSYDCFCFFDHISNSTKTSDDFAFFVFFTFKSWKRVILCDTPRQTINALTLYAVILSTKDKKMPWWNPTRYFGESLSGNALLVTSFFTVVVCAGSILLLGIAGLCYIPLLCHIRGNLKEYCCHKVDKRIEEIIKKQKKKRQAEAAKEAQNEARGDYSHLKNKKGELIATPLPQPTLPQLSVDDDETSSVMTRGPPPSTYTQDYYYPNDKGPPPMPAYNPYSNQQPPGNFAHFNPSSGTIHADDRSTYGPYSHGYDDDTESTAHLTAAAAPFARDPIDRRGSPFGQQPGSQPGYGGYQQTGPPPQGHWQQQQHQQHPNQPRLLETRSSTLGYDDLVSDYYANNPQDQRQPGYSQPPQGPGRGQGGYP